MIAIVFIIYAFLAVFEFVPLYKQKYWKDFWTNIVLAFFSLTVATLMSLNIKVPNPSLFIKEVITSLVGK